MKHYSIQDSWDLRDGRKPRVKAEPRKRIKSVKPPKGFKLTDEQASWMATFYPFTFLVLSGLYDDAK